MNIKQLSVAVLATLSLSAISGCAVNGSIRQENIIPAVSQTSNSKVAHNVRVGELKGFNGMNFFNNYSNLNKEEAKNAFTKSLEKAGLLATNEQNARYTLGVNMKDTGENKGIVTTNWFGNERNMIANYEVKDNQTNNVVLNKEVKTHKEIGSRLIGNYYLTERAELAEPTYKENFGEGIKAVQQL